MAENYIKIQEDISSKINKAKTNFKKTPKDRVTQSYIETRLETLSNMWSSFENNHRKIIYEMKRDEYERSNYAIADLAEVTEENYIDYKSLLKETLAKLKPVINNECEPQPKRQNVKLPDVSLPKFSGSYVEWVSFRDMFISLIHKNKNLDNVQKLHYLKCSLTGEAECLLKYIAISDDNYKIAWEKLENRYNNERYIANSILKRFMNQKSLSSESASSIKQILDITSECLSGLQNLGIDTRSWDLILIYIISQKLDTVSRDKWEAKLSESTMQIPTYAFFEEFLEQRFRSLEYKDPKVYKQDKTNCTHVTTTNTSLSCIFCSDNHKLCNCKKFSQESVDSRRKIVQTHNLCFNCLSPNHSAFTCKSSIRCRLCKRKHHSLLHPNVLKAVNTESAATNYQHTSSGRKVIAAATTSVDASPPQYEYDSPKPSVVVTCLASPRSQVLLATALVNVQRQNAGSVIVLRSLLDQGSQASFITESAVQMLRLQKYPGTKVVSGLGGDHGLSLASKSTVYIKFHSRYDPNFSVTVKAHVLNTLTTFLPSRRVAVQSFLTLPLMELADPAFDTPNKIDLLLGAEVYSQILMDGLIKGPPGSVIAQRTRLGWILSGRVYEPKQSNDGDMCSPTDGCICNNTIVTMHAVESESELLRKFWELESEPSFSKVKHLTQEEKNCEELFSTTTKRDKSGRYMVKLPFKTNDPQCRYGNSIAIALKRFLMLEKRLTRNPKLKSEYSKVLQEYLNLGHMEPVTEDKNAVYLPHHAVVREDKTTSKVRVVFDASCTNSNGVSLNNDLMTGPTLQSELRHLIMRWRCYPIAIVADIVKMYRQVKVMEEDADYQRILWRKDPNDEISHFRLLRVTFGTSSAPYLAVRALQQLAYDEGPEFPLAMSRVLNDFYVDDLMTGCHSVDEGVNIYKEMTELMGRGGFPIQKWTSNHPQLQAFICQDSQESDTASQTMEMKTDAIMKILGLTWNKDTDEFQCVVNLPPVKLPITKRTVISDIARLFDPLGWIAPAITTAKVFIQRLWLSGTEWDSEVPEPLLQDWSEFRNDLIKLTYFRIPRWINTSCDDRCVELHGFSDASNVAYAAVVYMRIIDRMDGVRVSLITSKTRVAPIKQVSIPRLELCGAVLLAKLLKEVAETLEIPTRQLHAWTDSTIVLAWLRSHPGRWKTFVANRVSEILTIMDGDQWAHVTSSENPADCASRGLRPSECVGNLLWNQGPNWLYNNKISYTTGDVKDTDLEEKKTKINCHAGVDSPEESELLTKFSTLRKLTRVIAFCRRVLLWGRKPVKEKGRINSWLTVKELYDSTLTCIKMCQNQFFGEDVENLQRERKLKPKSKLTSLNPFLDSDGILRVGGRLKNSLMDEDIKHPIIIPHNSHFTKLLIGDAHDRTLHGGPQIMLNYLRTRYWIVRAKGLVRQYVHKCVTCVRHAAQVSQQLMGQLPPARVRARRPFYKSGVDYAGPINIRPTKGRGYRSTKGYICLFICMATRAIHLEVVSDMTSQCFLAAFKRFVARRGYVAEMWSDNGTTFVGGSRELKELMNRERSGVATEIADWLSSNGTDWHFIPPYSPNFGGLWEAGIKSTKYHLKRIIGTSTLTYEELSTTLAQIEACLNSRPISQLSNNPEDPSPLTPGHFLIGEQPVLVPEVNYETSNITSLKRWHLTQRMLQDFWRRWSQEYLTQLQQRYKWANKVPEPEVGDLVLVKEDDLPPAKWLYGLIAEKHPGKDNLTRVVSVRYKGNVIKRPLSKLIILPKE